MAAAGALLEELGAGDALAIGDDGYYAIRRLCAEDLPARGVAMRAVDPGDLGAVGAAVDGAALCWVETPTNPLLRVHDLRTIDQLCRAAGVLWVLDGTAATPLLLRGLDLGAAAVLHSATKGLSGHSDVTLGVVSCADPALAERLRARRRLRGTTPSGFSCWLARRGIQTLGVRIRRSSDTALALARALESHDLVRAVHHPGLESHPNHETAAGLLPAGVGGLFSFELTGADAADRLVGALRLWTPATSFGGVESTIERRGRWSGETAPPGLVRCWAGLESPRDLWADLRHALDRV
jgi:cystathionine gamma-synthase